MNKFNEQSESTIHCYLYHVCILVSSTPFRFVTGELEGSQCMVCGQFDLSNLLTKSQNICCTKWSAKNKYVPIGMGILPSTRKLYIYSSTGLSL